MSRPHFLQPLLGPDGRNMALYAEGLETPVAISLRTAFDSASRRRGLLADRELTTGSALIIAPCNAVHTFGMRFAIDVIYVARDGKIVKVVRGLQPSRVSVAWGAFAVVEMAEGSATHADLQLGQRIVVR